MGLAGDYQDAMQLGAMDYLVEPLSAWEVGRLVEKHVQVCTPASTAPGN